MFNLAPFNAKPFNRLGTENKSSKDAALLLVEATKIQTATDVFVTSGDQGSQGDAYAGLISGTQRWFFANHDSPALPPGDTWGVHFKVNRPVRATSIATYVGTADPTFAGKLVIYRKDTNERLTEVAFSGLNAEWNVFPVSPIYLLPNNEYVWAIYNSDGASHTLWGNHLFNGARYFNTSVSDRVTTISVWGGIYYATGDTDPTTGVYDSTVGALAVGFNVDSSPVIADTTELAATATEQPPETAVTQTDNGGLVGESIQITTQTLSTDQSALSESPLANKVNGITDALSLLSETGSFIAGIGRTDSGVATDAPAASLAQTTTVDVVATLSDSPLGNKVNGITDILAPLSETGSSSAVLGRTDSGVATEVPALASVGTLTEAATVNEGTPSTTRIQGDQTTLLENAMSGSVVSSTDVTGVSGETAQTGTLPGSDMATVGENISLHLAPSDGASVADNDAVSASVQTLDGASPSETSSMASLGSDGASVADQPTTAAAVIRSDTANLTAEVPALASLGTWTDTAAVSEGTPSTTRVSSDQGSQGDTTTVSANMVSGDSGGTTESAQTGTLPGNDLVTLVGENGSVLMTRNDGASETEGTTASANAQTPDAASLLETTLFYLNSTDSASESGQAAIASTITRTDSAVNSDPSTVATIQAVISPSGGPGSPTDTGTITETVADQKVNGSETSLMTDTVTLTASAQYVDSLIGLTDLSALASTLSVSDPASVVGMTSSAQSTTTTTDTGVVGSVLANSLQTTESAVVTETASAESVLQRSDAGTSTFDATVTLHLGGNDAATMNSDVASLLSLIATSDSNNLSETVASSAQTASGDQGASGGEGGAIAALASDAGTGGDVSAFAASTVSTDTATGADAGFIAFTGADAAAIGDEAPVALSVDSHGLDSALLGEYGNSEGSQGRDNLFMADEMAIIELLDVDNFVTVMAELPSAMTGDTASADVGFINQEASSVAGEVLVAASVTAYAAAQSRFSLLVSGSASAHAYGIAGMGVMRPLSTRVRASAFSVRAASGAYHHLLGSGSSAATATASALLHLPLAATAEGGSDGSGSISQAGVLTAQALSQANTQARLTKTYPSNAYLEAFAVSQATAHVRYLAQAVVQATAVATASVTSQVEASVTAVAIASDVPLVVVKVLRSAAEPGVARARIRAPQTATRGIGVYDRRRGFVGRT